MLSQGKQQVTMKSIIKLLVKNKSFIFLGVSNIDRLLIMYYIGGFHTSYYSILLLFHSTDTLTFILLSWKLWLGAVIVLSKDK